jgi:DNA-binding transcriptional ArsR family regulator
MSEDTERDAGSQRAAARAGGERHGSTSHRAIRDVPSLQALAHPTRLALLEAIGLTGAMTATQASAAVGESPTACAYHLRMLARLGFVEEAGGGRGRSRPWRMTSIGWSFTPGGDPAAQLASDAALRLFRERSFARYENWRRTRNAYPAQWREASEDSEYLFYLTAEEMAQLGRELQEVLMRWRQLEGRVADPARRPLGSRPVETLLFSFPIDVPSAPAKDD